MTYEELHWPSCQTNLHTILHGMLQFFYLINARAWIKGPSNSTKELHCSTLFDNILLADNSIHNVAADHKAFKINVARVKPHVR